MLSTFFNGHDACQGAVARFQTVRSVMPLGVLGLLNLSSLAVCAVINLFWLGIAAHVRKGAGLKFDRHYLAGLVN